MMADVLRQLDEWGAHFEAAVEHVTVDEVLADLQTESSGVAPAASPGWRRPLRFVGASAVVVTLVIAVVAALGGARTVSREFSSVGGDLNFAGGGSQRATTAAPTTTAAASATLAPATTLAPAEPPTAAPGQSTVPPVGNNPAKLGRDVIFVGDLAIDTRDVAGSVTAARAIVESRGGYVFGQELGGRSTVVSLKVPAEFFQDTIDRLSSLGTVRSARITSQDVTERIVDLESQIVTTETSVNRLQGLLAEALSINTITRIEGELLQRETALEQLRGQLRTLKDQVALSTIVLTFREFVPAPELLLNVSVHAIGAGAGTGEQCFTGDGPFPEPDEEYVVCVDLTNTGNVPLADLEITGPPDIVALLAPVSGNRVSTLAEGERYVLWTTSVATDTFRQEIKVQAVPLNEEGNREVEQTVETIRPLWVTVLAEPVNGEGGDLPSLRDALATGWDLLTTGANALGVAMAFALPFLWIPALFGGIVWWRRRRS